MIKKAQKMADSMTHDYTKDEVEKLINRMHDSADEIDEYVPKKKGGALDFRNIMKDAPLHATKIPKRSFPKF